MSKLTLLGAVIAFGKFEIQTLPYLVLYRTDHFYT